MSTFGGSSGRRRGSSGHCIDESCRRGAVTLFIGSGGSSGGMLAIRPFDVEIAQLGLDFRLYWSWALFLAGTGLTWGILLMMD